MISLKWKGKASDNMFGCLLDLNINVIFKIKYMRYVEASFLKMFDTCVCYLN